MIEVQNKSMVLLGLTLLLVGCKSGKIVDSAYVSPRVIGRVIDAETQQPLANARISRVIPGYPGNSREMPKGGELIQKPRAVLTGKDGRFVVPSERSLNILSKGGWYSLTLSFGRSGYYRYVTNYTLANVSTNLAGKEPVIETGDIRMERLPK